MSARDEILGRLRGALADVDTEPDPGIGHATMPEMEKATRGADEVQRWVERFTEVVEDYRATVQPVSPAQVPGAVVDALKAAGCRSVVVPSGLDPQWRAALDASRLVVVDEDSVDTTGLDVVDAVVTASAVGIADTGTIVLDHSDDQGRRELSLVPDLHVCVVRTEDLVPGVPQAVARLRPASPQGARPLTWISGPSATSDIELERVEGVHGPRTLVVLLVDAA